MLWRVRDCWRSLLVERIDFWQWSRTPHFRVRVCFENRKYHIFPYVERLRRETWDLLSIRIINGTPAPWGAGFVVRLLFFDIYRNWCVRRETCSSCLKFFLTKNRICEQPASWDVGCVIKRLVACVVRRGLCFESIDFGMFVSEVLLHK